MKRRLIISLIAVALAAMLTGAALAATVYMTGDANVRTGPGLDYISRGTVSKGSTLTYLGDTSYDYRGVAWYRVSYGSGSGWVSSVYASLNGGGNYYDEVYAAYGDTKVRTGPGLGYSEIGTLYKGQSATYMGDVSYDSRGVAWYSVLWHGNYSWVSSRYTELY